MERMRVAVVKEAARATAVNFAAWEFTPAAAPVAETRSRKEDMADMVCVGRTCVADKYENNRVAV